MFPKWFDISMKLIDLSELFRVRLLNRQVMAEKGSQTDSQPNKPTDRDMRTRTSEIFVKFLSGHHIASRKFKKKQQRWS